MDTFRGESILRNDALTLVEFVPIPACFPWQGQVPWAQGLVMSSIFIVFLILPLFLWYLYIFLYNPLCISSCCYLHAQETLPVLCVNTVEATSKSQIRILELWDSPVIVEMTSDYNNSVVFFLIGQTEIQQETYQISGTRF